MAIPQIPQSYYGDVPAGLERGQRYAAHPNELLRPCSIAGGLLTSQVTEGTMDTINGSNAVGLYIDGVLFDGGTAASNAALVAALNALAMTSILGIVFSNPSGSTLRVAFSDYVTHTVTAYSPGTPDVTGITNTVAASNPVFVHMGRALVSDASQGGGPWAVKSAASYNPGSGYNFAGVMCRGEGSRHSDEQIRMLAYSEGVSQGVAPTMHGDMCQIGFFKVDLVPGSAAATRGMPAYFKTTSGTGEGAFQATDGGTAQVSTATPTANAGDASGVYLNDYLVQITSGANAAADRAALTSKINTDPVTSALFLAEDTGALVRITKRTSGTFSITAYSPSTADWTIATTTAGVAATATLAPGCRWGRSHAASSTVGYLEIGVQPNSPQL